MLHRKSFSICFYTFLFSLLFASCGERLLGYGVLLWSSEDPPVPSGTVLPVYIRSNIDRVWVVSIPPEYRNEGSVMDKFEVPLSQLELSNNRRNALERAEAFAPYALLYAENLQDGLPIRERADNTARRVYRLRLGEIIKILEQVTGPIPVGTDGQPLEGAWYRVLTEDGTTGFCFSYRLNVFEHHGGTLAVARPVEMEELDEDLDMLLRRTWSPEIYANMVNTRSIDIDEFSYRWSFDPGAETGVARINVRGLDQSFSYTRIRSIGARAWQFEGTRLQMQLRSDTTLAVQYTEDNGLLRTLFFVALRSSIDDIIMQEYTRRDLQFDNIFLQGPVYTSSSYGTIIFSENRQFNWTGNNLLVPQVLPSTALGNGTIEMRLHLSPAMSERYDGAFTLHFSGIGGQIHSADFIYSLDNMGFRIEHVPPTSLDGITVVRRASSPLIIFFVQDIIGTILDSEYDTDRELIEIVPDFRF